MSKASEIVAIALAEIGYREKASNSNLDNPTANAGSANWTKYARDLAQAGYYNGNKNGFAWCDVFVDWCFFKAYGKDEGQRIQCQTGPLGAGCIYSAQYYKQQNRYDRTPKVGDQVFFQTGGEIGHTGIVVEVSGSKIVTVEGNSSDRVQKNTYQLTNSYIAGFGHPLYDDVESTSTPTDTTPTDTAVTEDTPVVETETVGKTVSVTLNQLSQGCTGAQVKTIQRIMRVNGIDSKLDIDGEFGPITRTAVFNLQKKLFPSDESEWDGIVGKVTWTAMLTQLKN